jgi:hypothetical protein
MMKYLFAAGLTIATLGFAWAAQTSAIPAPALLMAQAPQNTQTDVLITMQRTACFGTCPVYQLTIYGDGRVVYAGTAYVAVQDSRTAQLTPAQVQQLLAAFEKANFFELKNEYTVNATDLPGVLTSITWNGRNKKVWHYGAIDQSELNPAPAALTELENTIDEIVNAQQWVGREP